MLPPQRSSASKAMRNGRSARRSTFQWESRVSSLMNHPRYLTRAGQLSSQKLSGTGTCSTGMKVWSFQNQKGSTPKKRRLISNSP